MPAILPFFVGTHGGSGTVTSIDATTPNSVLTITGGPITTAGVFVFTLNAAIESVGTIPSSGIVAFDALGPDFLPVTLTGTANKVDVSNGTGVGGNPTFTLPSFIQVNGLLDSNANKYLEASAATSAVNYLSLRNAAAGASPRLIPAGSDADCRLILQAKGSLYNAIAGSTTGAVPGALALYNAATTFFTLLGPGAISGNTVFSLPSSSGPTGSVLMNPLGTGVSSWTVTPILGNAASAGTLTLSSGSSGGSYTLGANTSSAFVGTTYLPDNAPSDDGDIIVNKGSNRTEWRPQTYEYVFSTAIGSGSPSIDLLLVSGPEVFELEIKGIAPSNGNSTLLLYGSTDGGATFTVPISYLVFGYNNANGPFISGGVSTFPAQLSSTAGASTGSLGICGIIKFWIFSSKIEFESRLTWQSAGGSGTSVYQTSNGSFQAAGMDAFRLAWNATTFSSAGSVILYGKNH